VCRNTASPIPMKNYHRQTQLSDHVALTSLVSVQSTLNRLYRQDGSGGFQGEGLHPGSCWGSSRRSPRSFSRLRRGKRPPHSPHPRRLRRLDPLPHPTLAPPAVPSGSAPRGRGQCAASLRKLEIASSNECLLG